MGSDTPVMKDDVSEARNRAAQATPSAVARARVPLRSHDLGGGLRVEQQPLGVDIERHVPVGLGQLEQAGCPDETGVVHQHVQPPGLLGPVVDGNPGQVAHQLVFRRVVEPVDEVRTALCEVRQPIRSGLDHKRLGI